MSLDFKDMIIVGLAVFVGIQYFDDKAEPEAKGSSYEQLAENMVRAQTKIAKDVIIPQFSKQIDDRINENNVKMAAEIKSIVGGGFQTGKSDHTDTSKKYSFEKKDLNWFYNDGTKKFPVGSLYWNQKKQTWKGVSYKLKFDTKIVQQQNYDGTYETFVEQWATHNNLKAKHGGGGRYPININSAVFQIKENKQLVWSFWNPTIGGGLYSDLSSSGFAAKFNFMNYGYKKQLPVYEFLSPTLLLSDKIDWGLEIGSVNAGHWIPVIKDLHVGAGMTSGYKPFLSITSTF